MFSRNLAQTPPQVPVLGDTSMVDQDPFLKQLMSQIALKRRQLLSPQTGQLPGYGNARGGSPYGQAGGIIGAPPPPPPPTAGEYIGIFQRFQ